MERLLLIALCVAAAVATPIVSDGHGVPVIIATADAGTKLAVVGSVPLAELEDDGFEVYAHDPGFGVNFASNGPPAGTLIGIETRGGLLFWDGQALAPTSASLVVEAPEFDSLGTPNASGVSEYLIHATGEPLVGMTWADYPGTSFWDAHGYFTLSTRDGQPTAGLYGVPLRLVDDSPTSPLDPSDPFVLPLLFDPTGGLAPAEIAEGIGAFSATLDLVRGDYDHDGVIDLADYDRWSIDFGNAVSPAGESADGNGNGIVDAADYTIWRDALASSQTLSVPEPSGLGLMLCSAIAALPSARL